MTYNKKWYLYTLIKVPSSPIEPLKVLECFPEVTLYTRILRSWQAVRMWRWPWSTCRTHQPSPWGLIKTHNTHHVTLVSLLYQLQQLLFVLKYHLAEWLIPSPHLFSTANVGYDNNNYIIATWNIKHCLSYINILHSFYQLPAMTLFSMLWDAWLSSWHKDH